MLSVVAADPPPLPLLPPFLLNRFLPDHNNFGRRALFLSLLWTVDLRLKEYWETTFFFLSPSMGNLWQGVLLCPLLPRNGENKSKAVYSNYGPHGIHMPSSPFMIAEPFCRMQRRPASRPTLRSQWPWWPHLMNVLKNGPLSLTYNRFHTLIKCVTWLYLLQT